MDLPIGINADSSTIDGDLDVLKALLDRFQQAGFSAVEIPVHGMGCILGGQLQEKQTERVRRILESYSFRYTVHGPDPVNLCDEKSPQLHASALKASIDFAKAIGSSLVVYHGSYRMDNRVSSKITKMPYRGSELDAPLSLGNPDDSNAQIASNAVNTAAVMDAAPVAPQSGRSHRKGQSVEKPPRKQKAVQSLWADEIERLQRIGEYAEKQGVTVAVENIFRQGRELTYRIDPRLLAEVIGAVGSRSVGICFDFGHAYLSAAEEGFSYPEAIQAVLPHLVNLCCGW